MSLEDNNYCYILSSDDVNLEQVKYDPDSPPPNSNFVVHIHANITQIPMEVMEEEKEEGSMLVDEYETHNFYKSFETQSHLLIGVDDDYESYSNISHMLFDVNVPQYAHQGMIREISNAAWSIASAKRNANCSSLTMSVLIGALSSEEPEDVMDYGINEDVDEDEAMVEDMRQGFAEKVSIST